MSFKIGDKVYFKYGNIAVYGEIIEDTTLKFGNPNIPCFTIDTWFIHEDGSIGGKFIKAEWINETELYPTFKEYKNHKDTIVEEEIDY